MTSSVILQAPTAAPFCKTPESENDIQRMLIAGLLGGNIQRNENIQLLF